MHYVLVFTFYSGDDLVGVDVKSVPRPMHPIEVMTFTVEAPSEANLAIVSCSELSSDDVFWIEAFSMVKTNVESN